MASRRVGRVWAASGAASTVGLSMAIHAGDGPPASSKQVQYLLKLLQQSGYQSFRDARRTYGLTQRQASGRFTVGEASALIDQVKSTRPANAADTPDTPGREAADLMSGSVPESPRVGRNPQTFGRRLRETFGRFDAPQTATATSSEGPWMEIIRGIPATELACELERRGWQVTPPLE
jgi:hypothetical protein